MPSLAFISTLFILYLILCCQLNLIETQLSSCHFLLKSLSVDLCELNQGQTESTSNTMWVYPSMSTTRSRRPWQSIHFLWHVLLFKFRFYIFGKDTKKWGCDLLQTSSQKGYDVNLFHYWKWWLWSLGEGEVCQASLLQSYCISLYLTRISWRRNWRVSMRLCFITLYC